MHACRAADRDSRLTELLALRNFRGFTDHFCPGEWHSSPSGQREILSQEICPVGLLSASLKMKRSPYCILSLSLYLTHMYQYV